MNALNLLLLSSASVKPQKLRRREHLPVRNLRSNPRPPLSSDALAPRSRHQVESSSSEDESEDVLGDVDLNGDQGSAPVSTLSPGRMQEEDSALLNTSADALDFSLESVDSSFQLSEAEISPHRACATSMFSAIVSLQMCYSPTRGPFRCRAYSYQGFPAFQHADLVLHAKYWSCLV